MAKQVTEPVSIIDPLTDAQERQRIKELIHKYGEWTDKDRREIEAILNRREARA